MVGFEVGFYVVVVFFVCVVGEKFLFDGSVLVKWSVVVYVICYGDCVYVG